MSNIAPRQAAYPKMPPLTMREALAVTEYRSAIREKRDARAAYDALPPQCVSLHRLRAVARVDRASLKVAAARAALDAALSEAV
jgi:hypothetical protein